MDLKYEISIAEQNYEDKSKEEVLLRQEFVKKFPKEQLKNLSLEEYALGYKPNNLCWWLEYNTVALGSIKGGSANKFKIYYSSKKINGYIQKRNFLM